MDNLEKILANLPKPKLRLKADLKIKSQLYYLIFLNRVKKLIGNLRPQSYILRNSLIVALLIIIIFSGTSIYAYSSSNVAPGSRLYLLKRAAEKAEQQVSFSPAAKSQIYQKFSQRRLEEALRLSRRNSAGGQILNSDKIRASVNIQKNIDEAVNNLAAAANNAALIKDQIKAQAAKNLITEQAGSETKYLNEIAAFADSDNDQEIINKVSEAKTAVNQYQNASLDDSQSDEPEEKNLNHLDNNTTSENSQTKQINSEDQKSESGYKASPRQRRERKNNNNSGGQKPSAQIQGVKINRDSETRSVQLATSSPINVPAPSDYRPKDYVEKSQPKTNEQIKQPEDSGPATKPQSEPAATSTKPIKEQKEKSAWQTQEITPPVVATSTAPRLESDRESDDDHEENYRMTATTTPERNTATTTNREKENDD